jgi:hypothetical protein
MAEEGNTNLKKRKMKDLTDEELSNEIFGDSEEE